MGAEDEMQCQRAANKASLLRIMHVTPLKPAIDALIGILDFTMTTYVPVPPKR